MATKFKVTVCNCVKAAEHKIDSSNVMILFHDEELTAAKLCRQISSDKFETHPSKENYSISKQDAEALHHTLSGSSRIEWGHSQKKPFCSVVIAPDQLIKVRSACIGKVSK